MRGSFICIAAAAVLAAGVPMLVLASERENKVETKVEVQAVIELPTVETQVVSEIVAETPKSEVKVDKVKVLTVLERRKERCSWRKELAWREWARLPRGERIARERNGRHPSLLRC